MFFTNKKIVFIEEDKKILQDTNSQSIFGSAQILYSLNSLESCAYINLESSKNSFISLLEQFFLRTKIQKEYPYIHIDYYLKFNSKFLTRGILSQSEYQNISLDKLGYMLDFYRYNTIIIEGFSRDSQNTQLLLNIINSPSISSNIIIIGDNSSKEYLRKNNVIFSNFFIFNQLNESYKLNSISISNDSKGLFLCAPKEIQSWLLIAQNFTYLKESYTKRFFFISNIHNYSKEVVFITFLKKYTKELQDVGNWDLMIINSKDSNFFENIEYSKQFNIIKQSFSIEGFTNLILSDNLNFEIETKLFSILFENTSSQQNYSNSIIFITSTSMSDTFLEINFNQVFTLKEVNK